MQAESNGVQQPSGCRVPHLNRALSRARWIVLARKKVESASVRRKLDPFIRDEAREPVNLLARGDFPGDENVAVDLRNQRAAIVGESPAETVVVPGAQIIQPPAGLRIPKVTEVRVVSAAPFTRHNPGSVRRERRALKIVAKRTIQLR